MKIRHDFHIHTVYSSDADESASIENYINVAKEMGFEKLGFAEHFWDSKIEGAFDFYKSLSYEHFLPVKDKIKSLNNENLQLSYLAPFLVTE